VVAEDRGSRVGLLVELTLFIQRPYKCVRAMFLCLVALVLACSFFHFLEPKLLAFSIFLSVLAARKHNLGN